MAYVDFVLKLHRSTKREYVARVVEHDKAECATVAKQYGKDYWDGDRKYGYGGYYYDGRWLPIAQDMARHYGIKAGEKILDVGCGKGFLLYEFTQAVPGVEVAGIDISEYAIENSKEEFRQLLLHHFPEPDILLNKQRMEERGALARDNVLPEAVMMQTSDIYRGIAEKITGKTLTLSDNPRAEIVQVLGDEFDLIA